MVSPFKSYESLAWTETLLNTPEEVQEEVDYLWQAWKQYRATPDGSEKVELLHLGCGAGAYDYWLKEHCQIVGVDLSEGMLQLARERNTEVTYLVGDMRNFQLAKRFQWVLIPDAIDYLQTQQEVNQCLAQITNYLAPGGLLMIVASFAEEFQENNFVYEESEGDQKVTLYENNHRISTNQYESTLVYLLRKGESLSIQQDVHRLGLFSQQQWQQACAANGLEVLSQNPVEHYQDYLMEEGEYLQRLLVCRAIA